MNKKQQSKRGPKLKSKEDKVSPVQVYVKQSIIDSIGGIVEAREVAMEAILKASTRKTKTVKK